MDRDAFILGMVTAFCECVAAGCKPLALSPPMTCADWARLGAQATALVEKHGLSAYHEENADLPEAERFDWLIIYAQPQTLKDYLALRAQGENPKRGLKPFEKVLGYAPNRIHTGYDAYRTLFPKDAPR